MTKTEEKEPEVKIAPQGMRIFDFMKASDEEIAAKTVDCDTCPVGMLCQAGEGGSGRIHRGDDKDDGCGATGVPIDTDDYRNAKYFYIVDCGKHTFNFEKDVCNLCDKKIMQHEVRVPPPTPTVYLLRTVHAKKTVAERKAAFAEGEKEWRKHYADKAKAADKDRASTK